jgi:hypothetical protein
LFLQDRPLLDVDFNLGENFVPPAGHCVKEASVAAKGFDRYADTGSVTIMQRHALMGERPGELHVSDTLFKSNNDLVWAGLTLGGSYSWNEERFSQLGEVGSAIAMR